jgi:hypothetical protein
MKAFRLSEESPFFIPVREYHYIAIGVDEPLPKLLS